MSSGPEPRNRYTRFNGKRSMPKDVRLELQLLDERRFGSGMVYLRYRTGT